MREVGPGTGQNDGGAMLTPEQIKTRRARNIAIGLLVALMVVLVYVLTIAKIGSHVAERAL